MVKPAHAGGVSVGCAMMLPRSSHSILVLNSGESHFQLSLENVPHAEGGTESVIAAKKTSGDMRQAQDYKAGTQSAVVCI